MPFFLTDVFGTNLIGQNSSFKNFLLNFFPLCSLQNSDKPLLIIFLKKLYLYISSKWQNLLSFEKNAVKGEEKHH